MCVVSVYHHSIVIVLSFWFWWPLIYIANVSKRPYSRRYSESPTHTPHWRLEGYWANRFVVYTSPDRCSIIKVNFLFISSARNNYYQRLRNSLRPSNHQTSNFIHFQCLTWNAVIFHSHWKRDSNVFSYLEWI